MRKSTLGTRRHRDVARVICVLTVLFVAACSSSDAPAVQINSLWYGANPGEHGVTHVQIESRSGGGDAPFTVDLGGLQDSGTDEVWNSAAWTGGSMAALMSGLDPRGLGLAFDVDESIGGPSAGALMSAGSIAALAGVTVRDDVAATGTVLADGSIGPVSGVLDKMQAAKDAGLTTVAYPAPLETSVDRSTGSAENIQDFADRIGIKAVPVSTVDELVALVAPDVPKPQQSSPGVIDSELLAELTSATEASLERMSKPSFAVVASPDNFSEQQQLTAQVARTKSKATRALADGQVFEAFASATSTERAVLRWNARQAALVAGSVSVPKTQAKLVARARTQLEKAIKVRERSAANVKLATVEQVAAVPDALSWATDAIATIGATIGVLEQPGAGPEQLANQASDLAQVGYDVDYYLPVAISAAQAVGKKPIGDQQELVELLTSYAQLLGDAGRANLSYVDADDSAGDLNALPDDELAKILQVQAQEDLNAASTGMTETLVAVSSAISFYTQTVTLAAGQDTFEVGVARTGETDRITITDPEFFAGLLSTAGEQSTTQARIVAGRSLDPSYVEWGTRWGLSVAGNRLASSDADRREGLVYLWYSTTSGRLLIALTSRS